MEEGGVPALLLLPGFHPLLPFLFRHTHGQSVLTPHERDLQKQRLFDQLLEPPIFGQLGVPQAEVGEAAGVSVEKCLNTELLCEAMQLPN